MTFVQRTLVTGLLVSHARRRGPGADRRPSPSSSSTPARCSIGPGRRRAGRPRSSCAAGASKPCATATSRRTDGARLIDLKSAFVLPGLIDAHVHIFTDDDKMRARARGPQPRHRGRAADWRRQRAADARGRLHDGAGPRLRRPQRDGAARRHRRRAWWPGRRSSRPAAAISGTGGHARRRQQRQSRHRGAAARARHQHLQRRRRLPARRAPADLAGRRRHQVHRHRRRAQQHRRRPGPADVRRRDEGHRRHGAPVRPQGGGARARQ